MKRQRVEFKEEVRGRTVRQSRSQATKEDRIHLIGLLGKVPIRSISCACTQQIYDEGKTSAACAEALDIVGHQVTNILNVDFHEPQNSRTR